MSVDNVRQQNKEVIRGERPDRNKELNYWYDYHFVSKKINTINFPILPAITEPQNPNYKHYSIPQYDIRFQGVYVALLCYLVASKNKKLHAKYIKDIELFIMDISETLEDTEAVLRQLNSQNKMLNDNTSDSLPNPFHIDQLTSHH